MNEIPRKFWNRNQLSEEFMPLLWVGVHIFANGFVSFLVIVMSTRKLQTLDLANFLVAWNSINVFLVVLLSPVEALAPKLLSDYKYAKENLVAMKKQALGSAVILLLVVIFARFANIVVLKIFEIFAIALFVFVAKNAYLMRSIFIAGGLFPSIARLSLLTSFSTYVMFQILYLADQMSVATIFVSSSVGTIIGVLFSKKKLLTETESFDVEEVETNDPIEKNIHKRLFLLSGTAFVQVGLMMSGVTVLHFIGGTESDIVMYASLAGLCSICFGFVNSASAPMSKSVALAVISGDLLKLKDIFFKNLLIYIFGILITTLFVVVSADTYLNIVTGGQIEAPRTRIVLTVLAMGAECVIVAPKIVLVGLGYERKIVQVWVSGIVVYAALLLLPIGPYERVCTAISVTGFYLFITGTIFALRQINMANIDMEV